MKFPHCVLTIWLIFCQSVEVFSYLFETKYVLRSHNLYTVWKFQNVSAYQNLREIDFHDCRSSKIVIFNIFEPSNCHNWNSAGFAEIDFTQNVSSRKIIKLTHCVINFGHSRGAKSAIWTHLEALNFYFYDFLHISILKFTKWTKLTASKLAKTAVFAFLDSAKLISRKILDSAKLISRKI